MVGLRPSPVLGSLERILVLLGIVLLGIITLNINSATRIFTWPWWGLWRLTLVVPFLLLLLSARRESSKGLGGMEGLILLAFAATYMLAAFASEYWSLSVSYAVSVLSICALACIVARHEKALSVVPVFLAASGVIYCGASIVAWLWWKVLPQIQEVAELNATAGAAIFEASGLNQRNPLLFGHWNYTAGVGVLALPWVVVMERMSRGWWRIAWLLGAGTVVSALLAAMSRGAWLGIAASGVFSAIAFAVTRRWPWRRMIAMAGAAATVATLVSLSVPRIRATAIAVFAGEGFTLSDEQRLHMAAVGGMMVQEHPLLGQGPGLTPLLYPRYRQFVDGGVETAFQLHSAPLQLAVDAGYPALAIFGGLVFFVFTGCLRSLRGERTAESRGCDRKHWILGAAGASLAGYGVYALTDYQCDVPLIAAMIGASLGLLLQRSRSERDRVWSRSSVIACASGFAAIVIVVWVNVPAGMARKLLAEGVAQVERGGDADKFDEAILRAAEKQPNDPHVLATGAAAHLRLAQTATDPSAREQHRGKAHYFLTNALRIEPNLEFAHFNLGWLELRRRPDVAAQHFRRALELVPDRHGVYFGLGLSRLESGDKDRAVAAFALEILQDPAFSTSPRWDAPLLQPLRELAMRQALAMAEQLKRRAISKPDVSLAYAAALLQWLLGIEDSIRPEEIPSRAEPLIAAINQNSVDRLEKISANAPGWQVLATAHVDADRREEIVRLLLFARLRREPTGDECKILEHLVDHLGCDWRGWLLAPAGREAPFVLTNRNERPAYGVMAYNLDIPTPHDEYVVQKNRLVDWFFSDLFPARGYLPASLIVEYVRENDL